MSILPSVVVWGAGGHALVVADVIRLGVWEGRGRALLGFLDDVNPERAGEPFGGATVLGGREQLDELLGAGINHLIIGVGDNEARLKLADLVRAKGFHLARAIHPQAILEADISVSVGEGTVIMAGAVVQPGCSIGENVIVNTGATVDHGCVIDDGVHIAPGAHLGGNVIVYRGAFVGMGAIVVPDVVIGPRAIVGAGSVVLENVPNDTVVYGNPARVAA